MLILPLMIVLNEMGRNSQEWAPLVVLLVFMLSISLAAVSLGVLMFVWLRGSAWALVIAAIVWGLSISDWPHGVAELLGLPSMIEAPILPFSGVAKLCVWAKGTRTGDSSLIVWALVASAIYAIVATLMFVAALTTVRGRSRGEDRR
jgi:hypothetical protein